MHKTKQTKNADKNTNIGGPYNKKGKNTIFFPLVHNSATFFV